MTAAALPSLWKSRGRSSLAALFLVLAGVSRAQGPAVAPARVPDTMAQRVLACTTCHGKEGRATNHGYFPRIAGKPAGYLFNQLVNFRDGRRHYGLMTYLVQHLTDDYLKEMAEHFAAIELPYPPPQAHGAAAEVLAHGEALVRQGDASRKIPACVQCHGAALTGVQPAIPGLLGLPRDYLNSQMGAWQSGLRKAQEPDCMAQIARQLTPQDIGAISSWLSSQPVPADGRAAVRLEQAMPLQCGGVTAEARP